MDGGGGASTTASTKQVLLFLGGVTLGVAVASGAAYGLVRHYAAPTLDEKLRDGGGPSRTRRRMSGQPRSSGSEHGGRPAAIITSSHLPLANGGPVSPHRLSGQSYRDVPGSPVPRRATSPPPMNHSFFREDNAAVYEEHLNGGGRASHKVPNGLQVDLAHSQSLPHPAAAFMTSSSVTVAPGTASDRSGAGATAGGGGAAGSDRGGSPALRAAALAVANKELNARKSMGSVHGGGGGSGGGGGLIGGVGGGAVVLTLLALANANGVQGDKPGPEGDLEEYSRVITPEPASTEEVEEVASLMVECMELRQKWLFKASRHQPADHASEPEAAVPSDINAKPLEYHAVPASRHTYRMVAGVMQLYGEDCGPAHGTMFPVPGSAAEFFTDMHRMLRYGSMGPVKSFCHHRLMLLEQKFNLHIMLNSDKEFLAQKAAPHRDFYNVRKVDTHIHHSACMHQKHLLRFIKSKLRKEPDEVVIFRDGKYLTLREVFESLKMTGYDLNVDTLDMHADKNMFHRFDRFNLKYNPCGQSRLREIFIKQDNLIHGRFLAELTQEVFQDYEASKYQHAELRISVYGRKAMEWDILASWIVANHLYSDNIVWLIQIPRLYNIYRETGVIDNFQQILDNIFEPLFEVTRDPASHPQLHVFLGQVTGFDMVDDESKPERRPTKHCPPPLEWNSKHNCAYAYYAYYIYANLYVLNKFREERGFNTFTFRPHAGEAGDIDHLATAFMLCDNIAHGINLRKSPCLQYLYYLGQVGLCMSPLSNNSLFLDYHRNPFPAFFARGLSVSLSTDDPLQIHLTKEPLVEEYSVAAQVYKLSSADLCEIARSGVLHSGFPSACKKHWVAERFWQPGPAGNDIHKTNVPNLRLRFRSDTYLHELRLVNQRASSFLSRKAAAKDSI